MVTFAKLAFYFKNGAVFFIHENMTGYSLNYSSRCWRQKGCQIFSILLLIIGSVLGFNCCTSKPKTHQPETLTIIHAGSLSYPVGKIIEEFKKENPGVIILSEAWGSKAGARRVMDLETNCDVFLSADYMVIKRMLVPKYAHWYLKFATNEMAIVFTKKSRFSDEITSQNWLEILLRPGVEVGRSDPDHDPCGYRSVFTLQLAEPFFNDTIGPRRIFEKSKKNIRPKETDLLALLEANHLDYIFLYRSVAQQHKLPYITLPDELNLRNQDLDSLYATAKVETVGAKPGAKIIEVGEAMVYGVTIPLKSTNPEMAERFVRFLLEASKGLKILENLGQPGVVPSRSTTFDYIPESLRCFALEDKAR